MAAGCIAFARISLLRHPSFWDETQAEQLIQQILEDPRLVNSEQGMYDNIAMQTVPFVAPLDEASVNVGFISTQSAASGAKKDVFRRLLANISAESVQDYGWQERHIAYTNCDKLDIGTHRITSDIEQGQCERRVSQRMLIARLELAQYRNTNQNNNSLFEAFSTATFGSSSYHLLIRQLIIRYMKENPREYAHFLGKDWESYLEWISLPGVAGDELILRALADRFGLPISVVTGDEVVWCLRYPPVQLTSRREIFLAVTPTACFSAIRRQSTLTSLKLTFGVYSQEAKVARDMRKKLGFA